MSDLVERVARMLAEYVEHGSADQMVAGEGDDRVPFWTRQVPFARDMLHEVLAAMRETFTVIPGSYEDEARWFVNWFAERNGLEHDPDDG